MITLEKLNEERIQTAESLERERQLNRKHKIEIETLLIDQRNRVENEQRLEGIIGRVNEEKRSLLQGISELRHESERLSFQISSKEEEIKVLENKLLEMRKIESDSWAVLEHCSESQSKAKQYEALMAEFADNLNALKLGEAEKVNYILRRNYQCHEQALQTIKRQDLEAQELHAQMAQLEGEKERLQMQLKFVEEQIFVTPPPIHQLS